MKRLGKSALALGAIALAAAALVIAFRVPLLEAFLRTALETRGVPGVALTVEGVTWRQVTIADLRLGTQSELRVRGIAVTYDPVSLLAGRLNRVVLDGAALTVDLSEGGPPLGSLDALAQGAGTGEAPALPLPQIDLRDGEIQLLTPRGPVSGPVSGHLAPDEAGGLAGSLSFDLAGAGGRLRGSAQAERLRDGETRGRFVLADGTLTLAGPDLGERIPRDIVLRGVRGEGRITLAGTEPITAGMTLGLDAVRIAGIDFDRAEATLRLDGTRLDVAADLSSSDGELSLLARAGIDGFPPAPEGEIRFEAELGPRAALWPLLPVPAPAEGHVKASLRLAGPFPSSPGTWLRLARGYTELNTPAGLAHEAKLHFNGLTYPGGIQGLSGNVDLRSPARMAGTDPHAYLSLSLTALHVANKTLSIQRLAIDQTLDLEVKNERILAAIRETGTISAERIAHGDLLTSEGPIKVRLHMPEGAAAALSLPPGFEHVRDIDIVLAPEPLRLRLRRDEGDVVPIHVDMSPLRVAGVYRPAGGFTGRIEVQGGNVVLPRQALAAEAVTATLDLAEDGERTARADIGALRHTAESPLVAPFSLHGEARLSGHDLGVSATATGPEKIAQVTLTGRHRTDSGAGQAQVRLEPLSFVPKGTQPGLLLPALAGLRNVFGQAEGRADLSWTSERLSGTAAFNLDQISFESAAARVEGLSLDLALDRLRPPASAPGQSLTVRRIDPGVPLKDFAMRFQVVPGDPPALAIAHAGFGLAGGRFLLADVVLDPAKAQQHLPVRVERLDLEQVFGLLGVEGLTGDGQLSGTLPIRVSDATPRIENARLAAEGPGLLQVRSEQIRQTLSAAGESADLLLRALEDFHYEELTVTVDQPSAEQAVVGLSLLGNNPAVLEGYPFRLNINLETDPQKLLAALRDAYRISGQALRQLWMLGP